jgi:hypothetical protein
VCRGHAVPLEKRSRAREAAGTKDARISGGAATVLQYLNAGWSTSCCRRSRRRSFVKVWLFEGPTRAPLMWC